MRAAVFYGARDVRVTDVPVPSPGPGEVLLQVCAAGICGTDAHEFDSGPHMFPGTEAHDRTGHSGPMVMGHEFSGRVAALGQGVGCLDLGELVVSGAGVACGACVQCRRGRTNLCHRYWTVGLQRDGGLAEYVVVPESTIFSVESSGLSEDLAGIVQPTAIAVHARSRGRVTGEDEVIVLGAGGIGAFLVRALSDVTSNVAVVDLDSERLRIASENGAARIGVISSEPYVDALKKEWDVRPSVVFEVSGTKAGFEAAKQWLEPGGRLVLVGIQSGEDNLNLRMLSLSEHEVIGTNAHVAKTDFPEAIELLRGGGAWGDIAPDIFPLDEVVGEGLLPIVERRAARIKTLFDPRARSARPTNMTLARNTAESTRPQIGNPGRRPGKKNRK